MVDDVGECQVWLEQYGGRHSRQPHDRGRLIAVGFGVAVVGRQTGAAQFTLRSRRRRRFTMMSHDGTTAVKRNLPAVWVLQNNYAIGTIRDLQRSITGREIGTSFVNERTGQLWNPDFAKMTEAMGGRGIRIEHPDQFGDAYREAIRSTFRPCLKLSSTAIPVCRSSVPGRCHRYQRSSRLSANVRFAESTDVSTLRENELPLLFREAGARTN